MSAFTPSGSGGVPITTTSAGATSPVVAQVAMASAATEYSYVLPAGCRQFQLKLQSGATLQVAYVAGQSGTNYLTVPRYCFYAESDLLLTGTLTVYFQSPTGSQVLEILTWV